MAKKQIIVMVVGQIGSGKSLAAEMLNRMNFEVIELGDIWRELLKKNNVSRFDPIGTREFTRKIRNKYGKDVYAKYAFKKIKKNRKLVAIMGVRSTYEMNYLKKRIKDMRIIALLAPERMRYSRLRNRGKPEDPKNMKSFKWLELRENRGYMKARSEEKHGLMHIMKEAEYVIANTSTVKKLEQNLAKVVKEIKKENN